jgi:hypothetical protein
MGVYVKVPNTLRPSSYALIHCAIVHSNEIFFSKFFY